MKGGREEKWEESDGVSSFCFYLAGNRWKGAFAAKLGHDDAVHGPEAGTRAEDLQPCESGQGAKAFDVQRQLRGREDESLLALGRSIKLALGAARGGRVEVYQKRDMGMTL